MAMDAGKFNFNKNIGGLPPQSKLPAANGPKESPSVQQDPSESVQIGAQPLADAKTDQVSTGSNELRTEVPQFKTTTSSSSIPLQVGDFLIAGPSSLGGPRQVTFDGITALQGLNSTSFQGVVGNNTLASVNPLNPKSATKLPTTSADLVVSPFEDSVWVTSSGRTISL